MTSGLFRTGEKPPDSSIFAGQSRRDWVNKLQALRLKTRYRTLRNQISEFLNISSYRDLVRLQTDDKAREKASKRAYPLLGNMFDIVGSEQDVISSVDSYAIISDNVIRYLKGKVLVDYGAYLEITNEIEMTSNPIDLLFIIFLDQYHKKARFEAKRKLVLMHLVSFIVRREREVEIEKNFKKFLDFLNKYVWYPHAKIGELETVFLISRHDKDNYSCLDAKVVTSEQMPSIQLQPGQKNTPMNRRCFVFNGRKIPIYVSIRKKSPEAKVLKLLRKGEKNPAAAVNDELGLMGVVDSLVDVKLFQQHLTQSATQGGSFMTLEDVVDNLTGGHYINSNAGSNPQTPMFKFFARMGGMRVEFILHSNETFLNYMYRRGTSHYEYEVKRFFDSGVAQLLFPSDIYKLDLSILENDLLHCLRKRIEESGIKTSSTNEPNQTSRNRAVILKWSGFMIQPDEV